VSDDPFNLQRFVDAQEAGNAYTHALEELRRGTKVTHWMWFVFPQIAGLGTSAMSQRFALSSLDEASAYVAHPVLGPRLMECTRVVAGSEGRSARDIFGAIDALKLRSSMTLFHRAAPDETAFVAVLHRYFDDATDPRTEALLGTI
jgi:uncharacterized protein (DUF1810 family)